MSSTTDIQTKYNQLLQRGLNLGAKSGAETDAGYGGKLQRYQNGNIYWHHTVGTYEVHGGILTRYLSLNGPGIAPGAGKRLLGFPKSDETAVRRDGYYPVSYFEWGAIYWIYGGVCVSGAIYNKYREMGAEQSVLGYPVSDNQFLPTGEVVYFERGCIWKSPALQAPVVIRLSLPLMGNPLLTDTDHYNELKSGIIINADVTEAVANYIKQNQPGILSQLWSAKINLRAAGASTLVPLQFDTTNVAVINTLGIRTWKLTTKLVWAQGQRLNNRQLYDIVFSLPGKQPVMLSAHSIYTRNAWDNFGLIHATDLHVSRRLDGFRQKLHNTGFTEAVQHLNNPNDDFRDLIRYANKLHSLGVLDGLILTGDLVDYIFENDDDREGGGNFAFFEKLVMGKISYPDKAIYSVNASKLQEELKVPIFTTLGNHDYRPNAYDLVADLDAGDFGSFDLWPWGDRVLENFSSFNLLLKEAQAIQGGRNVYYDMNDAASKVSIGKDKLGYYQRRLNGRNSYVVNLGINRLVMLDTKYDRGVVGASAKDSLKYIFGFLSESEKNFLDANPDSEGLNDSDISMLRQVLTQAGTGAVIVGMHAPPVNPQKNEMNHYFRETEHMQINAMHVNGFIQRHDPLQYHIKKQNAYEDWIRTNSLNFKKKDPSNLLDYGASKGKQKEFLDLCEGRGVQRKVNLVVSGHGHKRVEYRLGWNDQENFLRVYMDFYSENPGKYYPSVYNKAFQYIPSYGGFNNVQVVTKTTKVYINIVKGAAVNQQPGIVNDHRPGGWKPYSYINVPAYSSPLNDSANPSQWWKDRSPIIMETAALGPMEANLRPSTASEQRDYPGPCFQGFRLIQIENNVISKIRYVELPVLRDNNFKMPWEPNKVIRPDINIGGIGDAVFK
jgi:hypothetical protein